MVRYRHFCILKCNIGPFEQTNLQWIFANSSRRWRQFPFQYWACLDLSGEHWHTIFKNWRLNYAVRKLFGQYDVCLARCCPFLRKGCRYQYDPTSAQKSVIMSRIPFGVADNIFLGILGKKNTFSHIICLDLHRFGFLHRFNTFLSI